jgi:hypothetical protein
MPIVDIPTADEFSDAGKELFDFAWNIVAVLLTDIDQDYDFGIDEDKISDSYWKAAKRRLSTALSTTQQGVEFCLKGKIVEISPFLLIADPPTKWPSPYDGGHIAFSDFRTIDSQDLLRVLDTFSPTPMSEVFAGQFHDLRKKRNKIIHSVDKNIVVDVREVLEGILSMHSALFPSERWASVRLRFLEQAPIAELGAYEYARNRVCWELSVVIDLLKPSKVKQFFGIDKKQRQYSCPGCLDEANRDAGFEHKLAVLKPKGPKATSIYCPVCDYNYTVVREPCSESHCKGNVIHPEWGCLTCCG